MIFVSFVSFAGFLSLHRGHTFSRYGSYSAFSRLPGKTDPGSARVRSGSEQWDERRAGAVKKGILDRRDIL